MKIQSSKSGAKSSNAKVQSGTDFLISDAENGSFEPDNQLSSDFKYVEKISAVYFNYGSSLGKKLNFSFGARGRWTSYNLHTTANGIQQFKKSYGNFFP